MRKTIFACVLAISLALGAAPASLAAPAATRADALNSLGLFQGTGSGYALDRGSTRAEGLVMLIRLTGAEAEAQAHAADHGFSDVPAWADSYVTYGVSQGLTNAERAVLYNLMGRDVELHSSNKTIANQQISVLRKLDLPDKQTLRHIFSAYME